MRVTFVNPYYFPMESGIERIIKNVAEGLVKSHNFECSVVTSNLRFPDGCFHDEPSSATINNVSVVRKTVLSRGFGKFYYPSAGGSIVPGLLKSIVMSKPDVIHCFNIGAPSWFLASVFAARMTKSKLVFSPHFHPPYQVKTLPTMIREIPLNVCNSVLVPFCDHVVHCTNYDVDAFVRFNRCANNIKTTVIPPGVKQPEGPTSVVNKIPKRLLFVGRVDDLRKGFDFVETAFANAVRRDNDLTLELVGQISRETSNRLSLKFGNRVLIRGVVGDQELYSRMASASFLVMPSRYEGFGMPYIEAMSVGTPVIGSKIGPIPEVVPPTCGFLINVGDTDELVRIFLTKCTDGHLVATMGESGRLHASNFYWESVIGKFVTLYKSLMGTGQE
jgi:glycosyltransferase involved in cell wall biosynthesis